MEGSKNKLWGGRFNSTTNPTLERLNLSIKWDQRMYAEDIIGSQEYASALQKIGLLTLDEAKSIRKGLQSVKTEWDDGTFEIKDGDEDIHTANERRLKELIGETASKLHTGRSRNDQVVTDMKLWMRSHLKELHHGLKTLIRVIVDRSFREIDILMPGYTHLQRAQPVRWSHYLMSHAWNLRHDADRLSSQKSIEVMPLGSGALAGNPFGIDREFLAESLGFSGGVTPNSMQTVGDRDFIVEFLFWASLVGVHLSRLAEDLILYSSKEFDFVKIHDSFSTGSSLMPQKRNPDSLELIRGIGGSLFGHCCTFMMVLKSLPSTYNKDLQSDKEAMFTTFDKLMSIIEVTTGAIQTLKVNKDKCQKALSFDMLATDIAYYLVRKGVPFRDGHHLAGRVVAEAEKKGVSLHDLTLEELKCLSEHFDVGFGKIWNYENSIEQYSAEGGTAKSSVLRQIEQMNEWFKEE